MKKNYLLAAPLVIAMISSSASAMNEKSAPPAKQKNQTKLELEKFNEITSEAISFLGNIRFKPGLNKAVSLHFEEIDDEPYNRNPKSYKDAVDTLKQINNDVFGIPAMSLNEEERNTQNDLVLELCSLQEELKIPAERERKKEVENLIKLLEEEENLKN